MLRGATQPVRMPCVCVCVCLCVRGNFFSEQPPRQKLAYPPSLIGLAFYKVLEDRNADGLGAFDMSLHLIEIWRFSVSIPGVYGL